LEKHLDAIERYPPPSDVKALHRFVGLCGFYRGFVRHFAELALPLTDLFKKNVPFEWSPVHQSAFVKLKTALARVTRLTYFQPGLPLRLSTDASDVALGGVLEIKKGDTWFPIEFCSRKFAGPELNWSAFDKELCAAFWCVRRLSHLLEGSQFELRTDHKPVVQAVSKAADPLNPRQARQLSYLAEFDVLPVYVPGVSNTVADALSRAPPVSAVSALPSPTSAAPSRSEFVAAVSSCVESLKLLSSKSLSVVREPDGLLVAVSGESRRVVVPISLRHRLLAAFHSLHHPGVRGTRRVLAREYVWPRMRSDVAAFVRNCVHCSRAKVTRHCKPEPERYPASPRRFSFLHLDLVGPMPVVNGMRYVLSIVDRSTRWFEFIALPDVSASTVATSFVNEWVCRYGLPTSV
ncbi:MAG: RNase H-like domain-containing protein, partial [Cyanobacteria bacterium J06553_1]